MIVLAKSDPNEAAEKHLETTALGEDTSVVNAILVDWIPGFSHPGPALARDRLLRRLGDQTRCGGTKQYGDSYRSSVLVTSCGCQKLFIRVALLSEDGKTVPQGEPGEICFHVLLLAGGYWNFPNVTAETFKNGWLTTDDIACEGEDEFFAKK